MSKANICYGRSRCLFLMLPLHVSSDPTVRNATDSNTIMISTCIFLAKTYILETSIRPVQEPPQHPQGRIFP
jgi:hypothetical protein